MSEVEIQQYLREEIPGMNLGVKTETQIKLAYFLGVPLEVLKMMANKDIDLRQQHEVYQSYLDGIPVEEIQVKEINKMKRNRIQYLREKDVETMDTIKDMMKMVENQVKENEKLVAYLKNEFDKQAEAIKKYAAENEKLQKENAELQLKADSWSSVSQAQNIKPGQKQKAAIDKKQEEGLLKDMIAVWKEWKKKKELKTKTNIKEDIIELICNEQFTVEQMREIAEGQKAGLSIKEIRQYSRIEFDAQKMKEIRMLLLALKNAQISQHENLNESKGDVIETCEQKEEIKNDAI